MVARGPKRVKPLDPSTMVTMCSRVPVSLLMRLDEEVVRRARLAGVSSLNRSDIVRALLEQALATK